MADAVKPVMVVGADDSDHSFYALEWALDQFFVPFGSNPPFKLFVVHARPLPTSAIGIAGADMIPLVEADLKKTSEKVVLKVNDLCKKKSVEKMSIEVFEGDARDVMCDAVEKYKATILVVGSHGYGAFKRAVLGSVSDYCAHHAHCSVMIVKRPKHKN